MLYDVVMFIFVFFYFFRALFHILLFSFFFFHDTATPEVYPYCHTLSLHDALPISRTSRKASSPSAAWARALGSIRPCCRTDRTATGVRTASSQGPSKNDRPGQNPAFSVGAAGVACAGSADAFLLHRPSRRQRRELRDRHPSGTCLGDLRTGSLRAGLDAARTRRDAAICGRHPADAQHRTEACRRGASSVRPGGDGATGCGLRRSRRDGRRGRLGGRMARRRTGVGRTRSEEHTSELQSLRRNSYAVFCSKKKILYY